MSSSRIRVIPRPWRTPSGVYLVQDLTVLRRGQSARAHAALYRTAQAGIRTEGSNERK